MTTGTRASRGIAWDDEQARAALVSALVNDALALLAPPRPAARPG